MKTSLALVLAASLGFAGAASAQPSGGPDAKGNAPVKQMHTVNDGIAKPGANSFTQNEARKHILNSGYSAVSGLTKGDDGVWRGAAMKGGSKMKVALDFKGNVSEEGMAEMAPAPVRRVAPMPMATTTTDTTTTTTTAAAMPMHHHHHHRHHHHWRQDCAGAKMKGMSMNGAAKSGIDRDMNGISDKEDRAMSH